MHRSALVLLLSAAAAGFFPSAASAQSIVDLSKPQQGKSRFVLNPDLTPATLGAGEEEKPAPVQVVALVPACGEGCKLEQPVVPPEHAYGSGERGLYRSGVTPGYIVAVGNKVTKDVEEIKRRHRPGFRFRRR